MRTALGLLLIGVAVWLNRNVECGNVKWLPYEDEAGFGYREWRCQLTPGHGGQHSGWLQDG